MKLQSFLMLIPCMYLAGCLQTRSEVGDGDTKQSLHTQVRSIQATSAHSQTRFEEVEEQMRKFNGRLELIESRLDEVQAQMRSKPDATGSEQKLKLHEESIGRLESEVAGLKQALIEMPQTPVAAKAETPATTGPLQTGDIHFDKKEWRESILAYEKYREANPKGKFWPKATLRIGMAFQSMGLKKESQAFFQELIEKFPKSAEAKQAQQKLKAK